MSVGALVTVNQTSALATIHQTMPMNVDLTQSVDEMRGLRKQLGMGNGDELRPGSIETEVNLILSDGSAYPEAGTLRFADVGVDEGTGTVTIRAEFPNASRELLPGMFVRAVVDMGTKRDALLVPQRAVLRDQRGTPFVFVAVPGEGDSFKAERRSVTLGAAYGDAWLALDGLQAGDKVIVGGAHSVRNGGPVTVVTEAQLEAEAAARTGRATLAAEAEVSAGGQA